MSEITWATPITLVHPDTGIVRTITTATQANEALQRFWPAYHGSQYRRAEKVCDDALHGAIDPLEVRRTFIAAAVEAHFHLS
jgi:hypothetical protein